jgi:hypothetical protein
MATNFSSPTTTLELLIDEIEATPKEHWTDLLDTLRQFRQKIPSALPLIVNAEQALKNQAAIDLLDSWLGDDEDATEHEQTWAFLKAALEEYRLSDRYKRATNSSTLKPACRIIDRKVPRSSSG